ncbi:hypothetical protein ASPSYDRAFT_49109 [Aspergillus sydowii CBS 593.65]|uniref:Uncharacterized protein n=1 Tax=Aspergillus sydowii CBS 593.65 TaxID=1036612 RepID=A0A1L9T6C6_9EURO|nr:uncharacterized protein ASPSYDRAFT_49109 [Aspergillus sydowii CBS 593.65]OJJ54958.1 hypothetical protein ASPSYDRAFT_49109 [Aspergillus sydowii CBS 593.65]
MRVTLLLLGFAASVAMASPLETHSNVLTRAECISCTADTCQIMCTCGDSELPLYCEGGKQCCCKCT